MRRVVYGRSLFRLHTIFARLGTTDLRLAWNLYESRFVGYHFHWV